MSSKLEKLRTKLLDMYATSVIIWKADMFFTWLFMRDKELRDAISDIRKKINELDKSLKKALELIDKKFKEGEKHEQ